MKAAFGGVLVLVVASVVSCSDEARDDVRTTPASGEELPIALSERLLWNAPRVPPETAVSDGAILAVGGLDVAEQDGRVRLPESGLLVDLDAGTTTEVPAVPSHTPVQVIDAAGDASGFVVVGLYCDETGFGVGEYECLPGTGASFRLDGDGRSWRELPLPSEVVPSGSADIWVFQPQLGVGPEGNVFMIVRAGPVGTGSALPFHLLHLDGDRWVHATELSPNLVVDACAAADGVYVLSSLPGETVMEGPPPPAVLRLDKVAPGSREPVPVDLPDIDASIGGAAVAMACDRGGPYVTSSPPAPDASLTLHARRSGRWMRVDGDWGNAITAEIASAPDGIVLINHVDDGRGRVSRAFTVSASGSSATALDGDSGLRRFEPDVSSGGFVAVGPLPQRRADVGTREPQQSASITALAVQP